MTPSWPRLLALLGLTALPVPLTSGVLWILGVTEAGRALGLRPAYLAFGVYAALSWCALAGVLALEGARLPDYGLRFAYSRARIGGAAIGFGAGIAIYGLVSAILSRLGLPQVAGMGFHAPTLREVIVLAGSAVVTAPICEEIFFRVLWVGALGRRMPVATAAALSIVAFSAIHYPYFGLGGAIFISVWSLVPLTLFLRWGDLTAPLTMHVLNNALAYLVGPLLLTR